MANIKEYTVAEWAAVDGYSIDEAIEVYSSYFHGNAKKIYADKQLGIGGIEFEDGTYGIFGVGEDEEDLTRSEMLNWLHNGEM